MKPGRGMLPTRVALGLLLLGAVSGFAQTSLERSSGYVDFSGLELFDADDVTVEINLGGSLLGLLAESFKEEDTEFAGLLAGLQSIRVRIWELTEDSSPAASAEIRGLADELVDRGWEAVVRVRSKEEQVYILVRVDGSVIAGLMAMFVEPADTAGYVNIVGEFDPAQIGRLGRQLNIDPLRDLGEVSAEGGEEASDEGGEGGS